jgi:hypothetical protein
MTQEDVGEDSVFDNKPTDTPPSVALTVSSEATSLMAVISRAASDPATDVDKLERLLGMYERITERQAKASFAAALADMQPELPVIDERGRIEVREKDAKGQRTGAVQQSTSYALWEDINEAIKPALGRFGFALSFRIGSAEDGRIKVTGILSHRDGHQEETTMLLMHDSTGSKNAVQAMGSSVSYGKRYTALALLNITSRGQDDDGFSGGLIPLSQPQTDALNALADAAQADKRAFCRFMGVNSMAEIPASRFAEAEHALKEKQRRAQR